MDRFSKTSTPELFDESNGRDLIRFLIPYKMNPGEPCSVRIGQVRPLLGNHDNAYCNSNHIDAIEAQ